MKSEGHGSEAVGLWRWCPTQWPPLLGCGLAAGALVNVLAVDMDSSGQYAYVRSRRSRGGCIHKVRFDELHAPRSTKPLFNSGCANCKASCPLVGKRLTRFRAKLYPPAMRMPTITPAVSEFFAAMGRRGGSRVTPAKLGALAKARQARAMKVRARQTHRKTLAKKSLDG
jgi:hypothetical protein